MKEPSLFELRYWQSRVARGQISRREFLGRAAALGASATFATTMLAEVGKAEAAQKGGSARFAVPGGSTTSTLDPGLYSDIFTQTALFGAMSNGLTEIDADGNIVGDLAESFEPADGATRWIFRLHKGLTFHNGRDVTAEDVVASVRHHLNPESTSAAKSLLSAVSEIKADDKNMVIFTLKEGNADFPYLTSEYTQAIMPRNDDGTADWQSGIRTGPFILDSFQPGSSAKLKRNPNYHKDGKPYFDDAEFLAMADVTARTNALLSGAVDWIGRADLKTLDLLKRDPNLLITEVSGYGHYVLPMNCSTPPFDNLDVRLAIKFALDRKQIVDKIFLGHATIGNDNPIAPSVKHAINPEPTYDLDPDKAKFYLKKAGLSSLKVDLSVADEAFSGAVDAAVLYQSDAAKCGIEINVVREPNDGYWDNVWMKKGWCASYWSGRPTCDWMFSAAYAESAAYNETFWKNDRFNSLLISARPETDEKKRGEIYAEMQQLVHDDGGQIVLVFNNYVEAHSKKLAHGKIASNWANDGLKISERWWFA